MVYDRGSMQKTEIIEKPTKNILVIDDDKLVLKTLAKYLKNCGYSVTTASSGLEALDKIDKSPGIPDLIISDIRMPGISGIETLRQIRERIRNNNKTIPTIIITGYAGDEPYRQEEGIGISDYLYKPFEIDEFIKIVKKNIEPILTYARAHPRILASFPVKLKIKYPQDDLPAEILGETLTISEGGLSLSATYKIPLGLNVGVLLDLSPVYSSINFDARIVWSELREENKYYYGLQFSTIEDSNISILQEIFKKHKLLSEQFISLTQQLKKYVLDLKDKFDGFDNTHSDQVERNEFLRGHKEQIFNKLTDCFTQIWEIVKDFDRVRYVIHKDYYQRELGYLLLDPAEVNRRIYQKPLGYAGDYVIMNYIYDYYGDGAFLGISTYEKLINNYTCNIPVSRSNVARKNFLKGEIARVISENKNPKIISLGCGSARELIEILDEGKIDRPTVFKCLDLEREALKYIENSLEKIAPGKKSLLNIKYLHGDITSLVRDKKLGEEIRGSNLIYLLGVCDYLSDKMAERIIKEAYSLLENGGKLIVCNISSENSTHRAYYELLGEWCMIYRAQEEMTVWVNKLDKATFEFASSADGNGYHYLIIKKQ